MTETSQGREPGSPSAGAPPTNRGRLLLIASLALNLLFAGAAAGTMWKWKRHHGEFGSRGSSVSDVALRSFIRTLPKDRAKELRQAIKRDGRPDMRSLVNTVRQARRYAAQILASEPFDSAKLVEAFAKIDTADAATKGAVRTALIAAASQMTPVERQALAEHWKMRKPHLFEDIPAAPEKDNKQGDSP